MNTTTQKQRGRFRPQFALYHPNAKGTGSAVKMDVRPAADDLEGCIMMTIASQATTAERTGTGVKYATFDWTKAIVVKLGFSDICAFLQVFRGEMESIEEGRGLYHTSSVGCTKINLRHMIDPYAGYSLDIARNAADGAESSARFFFSPAEALGLSEAVCGVMSLICFGVPSQALAAVKPTGSGQTVESRDAAA